MRMPTTLRQWLLPNRTEVSTAPASLKPALYHFRREADGRYIRYHLRVDPEGPAILIAAASEALLLSPAGAVVAKTILEGKSPDTVRDSLKVSNPDELIAQVETALAELGREDVRYPIFNLVDPAVVGQRLRLVAPFQADVVAADLDQLPQVIDQLWNAGIPHVRLLLPAAEVDRQGVVAAVTHAQDIGMIAGVRARVEQLANETLLVELAEAGLDYVVLPWGITADFHSAVFGPEDYGKLRETVARIAHWEMTPVFDAAIFPKIEESFDGALREIENWNVRHVEVFAVVDKEQVEEQSDDDKEPGATVASEYDQFYSPQALRQAASWVEDVADQHRQQVVWLPPVGRQRNETLANVVRRGPRAGGDVTIRVTAAGQVIPPRGPYRSAGNLLTDSWSRIWADSAFDRYRERVELPTRCDQCPGLAICAADCPSEERSWATGDEEEWRVETEDRGPRTEDRRLKTED